jgi:hypothetical protein
VFVIRARVSCSTDEHDHEPRARLSLLQFVAQLFSDFARQAIVGQLGEEGFVDKRPRLGCAPRFSMPARDGMVGA